MLPKFSKPGTLHLECWKLTFVLTKQRIILHPQESNASSLKDLTTLNPTAGLPSERRAKEEHTAANTHSLSLTSSCRHHFQ